MRRPLANTSFNVCVLILSLAIPVSAGLRVSGTEHEKRVREFVEAFNSRDIDRMLSLVDENIQWLHIDGEKLTVNTNGKAALRESMTRYFRSCASCKSSLEWVQTAGNRATAMERASWTSKQGPKSQSSLSVYEFRDGKILRVYYFPAELGDARGEQNHVGFALRIEIPPTVGFAISWASALGRT